MRFPTEHKVELKIKRGEENLSHILTMNLNTVETLKRMAYNDDAEARLSILLKTNALALIIITLKTMIEFLSIKQKKKKNNNNNKYIGEQTDRQRRW